MQLSPYFNLGRQLELIPIFHSSVSFVPHSLACSEKAGAFFSLRGYEFYIFAVKTGSEQMTTFPPSCTIWVSNVCDEKKYVLYTLTCS